MRKAVGGIMITLAILIGMTGLFILACDTPAFEDQIKNGVIGIATMAFAFLVGWAGDKIGTR